MNGMQFWGLVALLAFAVWAVRRDRNVWSRLGQPTGQRAQSVASRPAGVRRPRPASSDAWLGDVQAWGDDLDGTARVRRTTEAIARADVYATVSATTAAQRARLDGDAA